MYSSDLRINTVHTSDISQLLNLTSLYLLSHSATTSATSIPDKDLVAIPFTFTPAPSSNSLFSRNKDKSSDKRSSISDTWKTVARVIPESVTVKIPLFYAVDDGNSTQGEIGKAVGQVWGIKVGYLDSTVATLVQSFAKVSVTVPLLERGRHGRLGRADS
jgi:hypothetical protein